MDASFWPRSISRSWHTSLLFLLQLFFGHHYFSVVIAFSCTSAFSVVYSRLGNNIIALLLLLLHFKREDKQIECNIQIFQMAEDILEGCICTTKHKCNRWIRTIEKLDLFIYSLTVPRVSSSSSPSSWRDSNIFFASYADIRTTATFSGHGNIVVLHIIRICYPPIKILWWPNKWFPFLAIFITLNPSLQGKKCATIKTWFMAGAFSRIDWTPFIYF